MVASCLDGDYECSIGAQALTPMVSNKPALLLALIGIFIGVLILGAIMIKFYHL